MSDIPPSTEDRPLNGVKLYSPGVLAAYFILGNLPIGMALYGLNVARRGDRWMGYILLGSSLVALVLLVMATLAGGSLGRWRLLALVLGVGIWQMERGPYLRALRSGAGPAPWWPPMALVLGLLGTLMVLAPET